MENEQNLVYTYLLQRILKVKPVILLSRGEKLCGRFMAQDMIIMSLYATMSFSTVLPLLVLVGYSGDEAI